jgi:succinate dehydrogenase hydrophobic membrane anchor protein
MIRSQPATKRLQEAVRPLREILADVTDRIRRQARNRGRPYLIAWAHRISGALLVMFVSFHILTLSALPTPERFAAWMRIYGFFLFAFLEWALAIPVIFHALNGGRLILYEAFGNRKDDLMIRWVVRLSAGYLLLLALVMMAGDQTVSPLFFWLYTLAAAVCVTWIAWSGIRSSGAGIFWKLQRITGAYLFLMIPAHMLFMHLNPSLGHDARVITDRMQNGFIKLTDLTLLLAVLVHGGCGLSSICRDYLSPGRLPMACAALIFAVMAVFAWIGIKLMVMI